MLLPPSGFCSNPDDGNWYWRNVRGFSLHFLSHHPQQRRRTLSETYRSSGNMLSSSALGIQDAGLTPTVELGLSEQD